MKRVILYAIALVMTCSLSGQQQVTGSLVTSYSDYVALTNYQEAPLLLEAGPNSFYWISGCYSSDAYHQSQFSLDNQSPNLFFIKYDEKGNVLGSNNIRGAYRAIGASSYNGGITVVGYADRNVDANGNILQVNSAYNLEFIANYDQASSLVKIISIWNLGPSQSAYSLVEMDKRDGSVYVYGSHSEILDVAGYGSIGQDWPDRYMYVIKYSRDLQVEWVYTAGFEAAVGYPYFDRLKVIPDVMGNVLITGTVQGDSRAVFGNDTLQLYSDQKGLFAVKLDRNREQLWIQEGSMNGSSYGTYIHKGMAMKNGDLVLAGVTTTGFFQLGDVKFEFDNSIGYANQFAYRISPDGTPRWETPLQSMGKSESEEKKGTEERGGLKGVESEEFNDQFYYDALQWNYEILYLTGTFLSDSFEVAGRVLEKKYNEGAFVASLDIQTGEALWGYGLSTGWIGGLYGFDVDGSGNVSLMGKSNELQHFERSEETPGPSPYTVFHLGLDYNGNPLWQNNAYLQSLGYGITGADLEVLRNGEVFSSIYLSDADYLIIGGSQMVVDFNYANWLVALGAGSEIGGLVTDPSGSPVYPGYVRAYKSSRSGAYPKVDSTMLGDDGRYLFNGLYPGNYTLQAVADPVVYPDAIPTYHGDQVDWNDAQFTDFKVDTKVSFLDIKITEIPKLTPEDGSGTMSGNVVYEEEGELKGTMGRPVKKATILVVKRPTKKSTNAGEVVAYVDTDEFGNFIFENIPDGDYLLIIDIPGLDMIEVHEVTIEGNEIVAGLDYTIGPDGIYTWTGVGIQPEQTDHLKIYPNPGNGMIFIEFPASGDYQVRIYGVDGRLVATREYSSVSGLTPLDISELNKGMYMIKIDGGETASVLKYMLE